MSGIFISSAQVTLDSLNHFGAKGDSLFYIDLEEALSAYNVATDLAEALEQTDKFMEYKYMRYLCLYELERILEAEQVIEDLYAFCKANHIDEPKNYIYNHMFNGLGLVNLLKNKYDKAISFLSIAIKNSLEDEGELLEDFRAMYLNLAEAYRHRGDYDVALSTIDDFISISKNRYDEIDIGTEIIAKVNKSIIHIDKAENEIAFDLLMSAQELLVGKNLTKFEEELYTIRETLATIELEKNNFDEALTLINYCEEYLIKNQSIKNSSTPIIKSDILYGKGEFREAIQIAKQGLDYFQANATDSDKIKSILHNSIAKAYFRLSEKDSSSFYFDSSLNLLGIPQSDASDFDYHIKYSDFNLTSFRLVADYASYKLDVYNESKDLSYLLESENEYSKLVSGSLVLSKLLRERGSKINLYNKIVPVYDKYISVLLLLIDEHKLDEYYPKLFEVVESNKSRLLNERLAFNELSNNEGIPDTISNILKSLQQDISFYEKEIYEEKKKKGGISTTNVSIWERSISGLKDSLNLLYRNLESSYPAFYNQRSKLGQNPIDLLRNNLTNNDRYLTYYQFDDRVLVLNVENESISHSIIENYSGIEAKIDSLLLLINEAPTSKNYIKNFSQFRNISFDLWGRLIKNEIAKSEKSNLYISPHARLYTIPYEILLSSNNIESNFYDQLDYLIRDFNISYVYNSEHVNQQVSDISFDSGLFIAPSFGGEVVEVSRDCNDLVLGNLKCAKEECKELANLFDGELLVGDEAKTNSLIPGTSYNILHFATHACLDNTEPLFNRIHFTDDYLSIGDINNLDIKSKLVTLSACNTASGIIESGAGVYNLAKGFMASGAQAVVSSLWSINDCSTKELMKLFYESLSNSSTKSESLRYAKVGFIDQASKLTAHPYYWSGFVLIGDNQPIRNAGFGISNFYILICGLLCLAIILFLYRQKNSV